MHVPASAGLSTGGGTNWVCFVGIFIFWVNFLEAHHRANRNCEGPPQFNTYHAKLRGDNPWLPGSTGQPPNLPAHFLRVWQAPDAPGLGCPSGSSPGSPSTSRRAPCALGASPESKQMQRNQATSGHGFLFAQVWRSS